MARMRVIGSSFDKGYRDDLNYNFGLLEALIGEANGLTDDLRQEMLNYINNLQQQINILTGENIDELLARLNDSIQQALTAAQEARTAKTATEEATALATTATELAKASALLAEEKANYANEKAVLAQEAANNANQEASNLAQLKIEVVQATQSANEEANNANEKATLANNAADRANLATENADKATSRANLAANAIEGWGTAEQWVNDKQYVRNNVVTDNGSTWQALRTNIGVTPVEGLDWTCLARKGLDGTGAVSSVNNRFPSSDGNVEVKWGDIPEKPTTFPPAAHTHEINDVTGLQNILDSKADGTDFSNLELAMRNHLHQTFACFGDSFTRTVSDLNAPTEREQFETYLFFNLVCDAIKPSYKKNNGISGSRLENLFRTVHSVIRNDVHYNKNLLNIGFNDLTDFKGISNTNEDIANKIQTACIYLKTRNRKSDYAPNSWLWIDNDELGYEIGATSGKLGVRYIDGGTPIEFSFTGRHLVIFTVDNVNSGDYVVKCDGVEIFNGDIKRNKRTGAAAYCLKVDCETEDTHTIQFNSPNGRCYISGYGEYDESIEVYVNELTKRIDTTFDNDTNAINSLISSSITELNDNKIKVVKMNNYLPSIYVGTDNSHPNILGHLKMAENILSTMIK
ncbi:hypothetical protein [Lysinibacillus sp. FW12]|uniref:hypothetical protein n=1 Tax=Lysinibacillus sp. FW12 TaxID=3096079 RepID=UPI003D751A0C